MQTIKLYIRISFIILGLFFAGSSFAANPNYVNNPSLCPTDAFSQSCVGGKKVCGVNSSNVVSCYDTGLFNPPASQGSTSGNTATTTGGYYIDCYYQDAAVPYCDNSGSFYCMQNTTCSGLQKVTLCTANTWAASTCGSCKTGYNDCDGNSANGCSGATERDGAACTIGGVLPGTYQNCVCIGSVLKLGSDSVTNSGVVGSTVVQAGTAAALFISGSNIGIGTSLPNDILSIANSGVAPAGSDKTGHNYASTYLSSDNYALANYGVVKSLINGSIPAPLWSGTQNGTIWNGGEGAGSVGIGTMSPNAKLEIKADRGAAGAIIRISGLRDNSGEDITGVEMISDSGDWGGGFLGRPASGFRIYRDTDRGDPASNNNLRIDGTDRETNPVNYLSILGGRVDGYVGIGVADPQEKLHVSGNARIDGAYLLAQKLGLGNGAGGTFNYLSADATRFRITNSTESAYYLSILNSTGNVGINTAAPNDIFSIGNDAGSAAPAGSGKTGHNYTSTYLTSDNYALTNYGVVKSLIYDATSSLPTGVNFWGGTKNGTIWNGDAGAGSVGIGTTNPGRRLEVTDSGFNQLSLYRNAYGGNFGSLLEFALNNAGGSRKVYADIYGGIKSGAVGAETGFLSFRTTNAGVTAEAMRIDNNGNVGIGTTAPNAKLEVSSGDIYVFGGSDRRFLVGDSISAGQYGGFRWQTSDDSISFGHSNSSANLRNIAVQSNGDILLNGGITGNVGVGITNPNARLYIQGTIKSQNIVTSSPDSNFRRMINVASYEGGGIDRTGILTIKLPSPLPHSMSKIKISGWSYNKAWDIVLSGYMRPDGAGWTAVGGSTVTGNPPFNISDVKLVADNTNDIFYILLGNAATNYGYYVSVGVDVDSIYSDALPSTGWDIYIAASNPTFDTSVAPVISLYGSQNAFISGNVGIGTTAPNDVFSIGTAGGAAAPAGSDRTGHNNASTYLSSDNYALANYGVVKTLIASATSSLPAGVNFWGGTKNGAIWNGDAGAGNVGIGTTAPLSPLDVQGIITTRSASPDNPAAPTEGLRMAYTSTADTTLYRNSIFNEVSSGPNLGIMQFRVNNGVSTQATVMSLLGSGSVGIGTTAPNDVFSIGTTGGAAAPAGSDRTGHNNASTYLSSDNYALTNYGVVKSLISSATSSAALWGGVKNGNIWNGDAGVGNVGVGTTNPLTKLQISSGNSSLPNTSAFSVVKNEEGYGLFVGVETNGNSWLQSGTRDNTIKYNLTLQSQGGDTILNPSAGNVGVGTTLPVAKLDVRGQIVGGFGAIATVGTLDWNHLSNSRPGSGYTLLLGNATNGPNSTSNYYHPFNFEYASKDGSGNITQLAFPYGDATSVNGGIYMRGRYSSTWSPWRKIVSEGNNGNVGIGTTAPNDVFSIGTAGGAAAPAGSDRTGHNNASTYLSSDNYALANYGVVKTLIASATSSLPAGVNFWGGTKNGNIWNGDAGAGNVGIGTTNPFSTLNVKTATDKELVVREAAQWGGLATAVGVQSINTAHNAYIPFSIESSLLTLNVASGGNVGIGTTAPGSKLGIAGIGVANTPLTLIQGFNNIAYSAGNGLGAARLELGHGISHGYIEGGSVSETDSSSGYLSFGTRRPVNSVLEAMRISSSGNIGIGTTNPATKLAIYDLTAGDTRQVRFGYDDTHYWEMGRNDTLGGLEFKVKEAAAAPSTKLFIQYGGNVGIGTTAPNDVFSIGTSGGIAAPAGSDRTGHNNASTYLSSDNYALANYGVVKTLIASATSSMVSANSWNIGGNTLTQTELFGTLSNHPLPFIVNNTEVMRLQSNGSVSIDAGTSTTVRLAVSSPQGPVAQFTSKLNGGLYTGYIGNGAAYTGEEFGLYEALGSNPLAVYDYTNSMARYGNSIIINSSNNVGIGTTVPNDIFSIGNSGAAPAGSINTGHNYTNTYLSSDTYALANVGYVNSLLLTSGGLAVYSTSTPLTYQGAVGSYTAANALCAAVVTGAHVCTSEEMLNTVNKGQGGNIPVGSSLWINNGPPGYTANANDCQGWTNSATTFYGAQWNRPNSGYVDGFGSLNHCDLARKFACCK